MTNKVFFPALTQASYPYKLTNKANCCLNESTIN